MFPRAGWGSDLHRIVPADLDGVSASGFMLAGVRIDDPRRVLAHSDGDVAFHALADALLGALACGDLGDLFPDDAPENANRDSAEFLLAALDRVRAAGYRVGNVDVTIRLQQPRLGLLKARMRERIAGLLGLDAARVSIKAKTGEGLDAVGLGHAVAAEALALLLPVREGAET